MEAAHAAAVLLGFGALTTVPGRVAIRHAGQQAPPAGAAEVEVR
jgi:hypothetical protein